MVGIPPSVPRLAWLGEKEEKGAPQGHVRWVLPARASGQRQGWQPARAPGVAHATALGRDPALGPQSWRDHVEGDGLSAQHCGEGAAFCVSFLCGNKPVENPGPEATGSLRRARAAVPAFQQPAAAPDIPTARGLVYWVYVARFW